jgi:F-type H+-transporting ATPase subunit a
MISPLVEEPLFHAGPVPVTGSVITSFAVTAALGGASFALSRWLSVRPGRAQAAVEVIVVTIQDQIRDVVRRDPAPYVPVLAVLPMLHAPTERLETVLALALVVFFSVYAYGIRAHGVLGYLKHFCQPTPLLAPIHVLSEITRTFSLMMRLLGNIMSHGLVLAVVVSIAGFLVPIPIMAFGLLIGLVQAYIFTVLATVYIGAAVGEIDGGARST